MADIARALDDITAGRANDPLAPVTVVVPSHLAGIQLRRRLAEGNAFASVRFETLPRLAEIIAAGDLASAGRSPLARPIGDYVAKEVARRAGAHLAAVRDLPGFGPALRGVFRRLRRGGIRAADDVRDRTDARLAEVLRLYGLFRAETAAFYDDEDLLDAAAAAVARRPTVGRDLGSVYVVPPGALTAGADSLLRSLQAVSQSFAELDETVGAAEHRFVLAPEPAVEAREAVQEVVQALEGGLALHQVAVLHGADRSYARLLREAFASAAVPCAAMPGAPLVETAAGSGVLALARLPEEDYSRAAVLDFLSGAPLRRDLPGTNRRIRALSSAWDRVSRQAGITHGAGRWSDGLQVFVDDARERAAALRGDDNERAAAAVEREAGLAADLDECIRALISRLEPLRRPMRAAAFIDAFKGVVGEYLEPTASGLENAIAEVEQLGTVGAVGGSFDLPSFTAALQANLELAFYRERGVGEGVLLADYRAAAGLSFRRVVLCGAHEGSLPASPGQDVLLQDATWSALHDAHPYVEDAAMRLERSRRSAERAVTTAGEGVVVWTCPLYEPSGGREFYPSPMMVAAAATRDAGLRSASALRGATPTDAWLRRPASPLLAMLQARPALDLAETRVREAVSMRRNARQAGPEHRLRPSITLLRARRSAAFTAYDGNLSDLAGDAWMRLRSPASPTVLESYAVCGFRYLCRSLLRLNVIEEPQDQDVMDAASKGALVHDVLQKFFLERQQEGRPRPGDPWTAADALRLLEIAEEELLAARRRGKTGLDLYAGHEWRQMRGDLVAFLEEDSEYRLSTSAVPSEFEVATPETLVGGLLLRGYADRVDRSEDRTRAWVIDYKTGSSWSYKRFGELPDPFLGGTKLQLPAYLAAAGPAHEVEASYWFITRRAEFERVTLTATPEVIRRFHDVVRAIGDGVAAGAFPAVPGEDDERLSSWENCSYCEYTRICSRRRKYEYEAKSADPPFGPWLRVAFDARGGEDTSS